MDFFSRSVKVIGVALTMLLAVPVQAQSGHQLTALEADSWRARMGFHLLSLRGNAPEDQQALEQLLALGERRLQLLAEEAMAPQQLFALQQQWRALSKRARENPLASQGYADYNAMSEMNVRTLEMVATIEQAREHTGARHDLLAFSVALQKLSSEYMALSAFPSAGLPTGTELPPMDFAEQAMTLDKQLAELESRYQADSEVMEGVAFARQRWEFIRTVIPRLNQPGAERVPYLFYRYSNQVAERMLALVVG